MPFNEDQYFYAALYWTQALPGGEAYADEICKKYGKPYIPLNPPKRSADDAAMAVAKDGNNQERKMAVREKIEHGINQWQCENFFDSLLSRLEKDGVAIEYTGRGNGTYKSLRKIVDEFSPAVEAALKDAFLDREILSPMARTFLHDMGEMFAAQNVENKYPQDIQYPGKPPNTYKSLTQITGADMQHEPQIILEYKYRIVPVQEGQEYKIYYTNLSGARESYDWKADPGDVFIIDLGDAEDVAGMTDDEILTGMHGGFIAPAVEYSPGYYSDIYKVRVEGTDDPRIIRHLSQPLYCKEVEEKCHIGHGASFERAEPGDLLVCEPQGRPHVIRREAVDRGRATIIAMQAPAVKNTLPIFKK